MPNSDTNDSKQSSIASSSRSNVFGRFVDTSNKYGGIIGIIGVIVSLGLVSTIYNFIYPQNVLRYTILPTYELDVDYFSGVVVRNQGRSNLNDLRIILRGLDAPISQISTPGLHEPISVVDGGTGYNYVTLELQRLPSQGVVPVYLLAEEDLKVSTDRLLVSSAETTGDMDSQELGALEWSLLVLFISTLALAVFLNLALFEYKRRFSSEMDSFRIKVQDLGEQADKEYESFRNRISIVSEELRRRDSELGMTRLELSQLRLDTEYVVKIAHLIGIENIIGQISDENRKARVGQILRGNTNDSQNSDK